MNDFFMDLFEDGEAEASTCDDSCYNDCHYCDNSCDTSCYGCDWNCNL